MTIDLVEDLRSNSRLDTSCLPEITQNRSQRELIYTDAWTTSYTPSLCIILKVYMEAYSVQGATGTIVDANNATITVTNWNQAVFLNYCRKFKESIISMWNNKLWLVPSDNWGEDLGRSFRPNIRCDMRVDVLLNEDSFHHLHIRCVNMPTGSNNHRPFCNPSQRYIQIDSNVSAQTIGHEVGHYLGLDHVNQQTCINAGLPLNNNMCYGLPGSYQRADIMGAGSRVEEWHAQMWTNRINRHTLRPSVSWRAVTSPPQPQHITRQSMSSN